MLTKATSETKRIYEKDGYAIHWIGTAEDSAFRSNSFLLIESGEAILVESCGDRHFDCVLKIVDGLAGIQNLKGMTMSHQDPDFTGSLAKWLNVKPNIDVISSPRTHILLDNFAARDYSRVNIEQDDVYTFGLNGKLRCIEAPFLHSPASITFYDELNHFLYTGDIWGAVDLDWKLEIDDFKSHVGPLNAFNLDYMASSVAAQGFIRRLDGLDIQAIVPQHGSIIPQQFVAEALEYMRDLMPGLDLLYPDL